MSPARRGGKSPSSEAPADLETQLARVADSLYALKPDDFAAARDADVRSARDAGQQPLAREIARLRKPTQSAWLINLLWRDQHDVMEQLLQLAQELGQAQADAAGPALRELTAQRRQIENALMRRAVELGTQAGVRVSDSVAREAQETLSAALARPEVASEVRSGRLVKPASYVGFGGAVPATTPAAPRASPALIDLDAARQRRAEDQRATDTEQQKAAEEEAVARQRAETERRQQRERALATARAAAERASARLTDATHTADEAHARVGDLRQRLDTLRAQLERLESEVDTAEAAATQADQARRQAEADSAAAIEVVKTAEASLSA